jgi:pyruvate dehydrogenase E2 component (dihydrolipoamide acetyltransferase)
MEEGVVAEWRVAVGDKVKRGQVIADIETDKATMEFESFDKGTVLALVAEPGTTLPIGAPIAVLGKPGEDPAPALAAFEAEAGPILQATEAHPAAPAEPEPPPTTGASAPGDAVFESSSQSATPVLTRDDGRIPASPIARRLAREAGLELGQIRGSGPHGRVVKSDVDAAIAAGPGAGAPASAAFSSDTDEFGRPYVRREDTREKPSLMRRTIAKRMTQSQQQIPQFYATIEIEMDRAAQVRGELNLAVDGTKVSFNDMVVLGVARALMVHPEINATWIDGERVMRGNIDVGMAVAVSGGLVVPVVRNTEQKTLAAISRETRALGKKAKDKTLTPDEMTGSTFTVSNLGMFGIKDFVAMVNPGEGAILAVGAVADQAVVRDGEMVVRKMMSVTAACDHRVIDGAMAARFLATLRQILENPMHLFA